MEKCILIITIFLSVIIAAWAYAGTDPSGDEQWGGSSGACVDK